LGKQPAANRPYKLGLTSKYSREGKDWKVCWWKHPRQGLLSAWNRKLHCTRTRSTARLGLHHSVDVTFGVEVTNCQI